MGFEPVVPIRYLHVGGRRRPRRMAAGFATLRARNRQPELMDQPGLDESLHAHALRSLSRINWISRTSAVIWRPIRKLALEADTARPLRILDVACGGGDVAIGLAKRAARAGLKVQVDGCDINPVAVEHARASALLRNRWAYLMAVVACQALTRSPIVHVDGPRSVAAAFTIDEARAIAKRAGLSGATFTRCFPERFLFVWRRPL